MKRPLLLALVLSLLITACGGGSGGVAATVNGAELTVADVRGFPYQSAGAIEQAQFAQYLGALIQWHILDEAARSEFGIDPTEEEIDAELDTVLALQAGGMSLAEVAETQNLSEETIRRIVRVGIIQRQLGEALGASLADPTDDEVAAALQEERAGLTEVCARHILVASEEEAATARERIESGEDFATVAGELSIDPSAAQNGGDLGCSLAQRYVPEFRDAAAAAEIDVPTQPVQSQFGFHVILVYDKIDPDPAELSTADEAREFLREEAGFAALEAWLERIITEANVVVNEEYGTWSVFPQPGVIPPAS